LALPSLDYFIGREHGMHEMATYAKPCIEKLLLRQRAEAVNAINNAKSDIQSQYNKALTERSKQIMVATAGSFLNALKFHDNTDSNNVRGLNNGILVCKRDTGKPLHVLPNQYLLFRGDTKCYFSNNTDDESETQSVIGSSFKGAYEHQEARSKKEKTWAFVKNPHNHEFPINKGTDEAEIDDGSTRELEGVFCWSPVVNLIN